MNRRGFLAKLGLVAVAAAVAAVDPDLLTWTPTKTIFVPPVTGWAPVSAPLRLHEFNIAFDWTQAEDLWPSDPALVSLAAQRLAEDIDRRISMRYIREYDLVGQPLTRFDVIVGSAVVRPDLMCRVHS